MRPIISLLPFISVLLSGCACLTTPDLNADRPSDQVAIERRLNEIFDAAAKKNFARLDSYHFYGPKFTKFSPGQPGRQDAIAARNGEHKGLAVVNDLAMRADDLKIDVFSDVGIATFTLAYSFKTGSDRIEKKEHSTLVFVKDHGAWKITHEHFSVFQSNPQ